MHRSCALLANILFAALAVLLTVFGVLFVLALAGVILEAALYETQWGLFVRTCVHIAARC